MTTTPASTLSASRRAMLMATILGIVLGQALEAALSASGLLFLDFALALPWIGSSGTALGFTLVMQIATLVSDYIVAGAGGVRRGLGGLVLTLIALGTLVTVETVAAGLHYVQLTNLARGEDLVDGLAQDTRAVQARLAAADQQYRSLWRDAISTYQTLSDDSRHGRDQTGIAKCGPLCIRPAAKAREIRRDYAGLGIAVPVPDTTGLNSAGYAALMVTVDALRPKAALLKRMCATLARECVDPLGQILADPSYARLQQAFGGAVKARRATLVVQTAERDARHLLAGQFDLQASLVAVFTLLLPFANFMLMVYARVLSRPAPAADRIRALKQQAAQAAKMTELETQIGFLNAVRAQGPMPAE